MQEQQMTGKARIVGYCIGIVAVVGVLLWRVVVR